MDKTDGWIKASERLPSKHLQDVIVYRYRRGGKASIEHSIYFKGKVLEGFGNVADEEGFLNDVIYWQPIETKNLYAAMAMELQISES